MARTIVRRVIWADAFTTQRLAGNPCAVVFDAAEIPVEQRLAFTRETRLSECSFIVPSDKADFGARYYLASREIPIAGHPTVATAAALDRVGALAGRERFTLELGGGVVTVEVDRASAEPVYTMTQPAPVFGDEHPAERIAPLLSLQPEDILGTPQTVSTGNAFCVTWLTGHEALSRVSLDHEAVRAAQEAYDFWEPFPFVTSGFTAAGDTAARLQLLPPEPAEDPFTGSATGAMAAYAWARGLLPGAQFTAEQGHPIGRPGTASVEVLGEPTAITGVKVGGPAVIVMDGSVFF